MCSKEEQNGMVDLIRKAGWVRTVIATVVLVIAIIGATWGAHERVEGVAEDVADKKIEVHRLESEVEIQRQIGEIQTEQRVMDTKIDMLLRAEGLEPPE